MVFAIAAAHTIVICLRKWRNLVRILEVITHNKKYAQYLRSHTVAENCKYAPHTSIAIAVPENRPSISISRHAQIHVYFDDNFPSPVCR